MKSSLIGTVADFARDGAANFVVQAVLRRLSAELERDRQAAIAAGDIETDPIRSSGHAEEQAGQDLDDEAAKRQAKKLRKAKKKAMQAVDPAAATSDRLLQELMDPALLSYMVDSRSGVVLGMLELVRWLPPSVEVLGIDKAGYKEALGSALLHHWSASFSQATAGAATSAKDSTDALITWKLTKQIEAADAPAAADPKKPHMRKGGPVATPARVEDKGEVALLQSAKLVGGLLKLQGAPTSVAVSGAISRLPADHLGRLATAGQLSKAILDSFFDFHSSPADMLTLVTQIAAPSGSGSGSAAAEMAGHFVGQHVVRRAFERSDAEGEIVAAAPTVIRWLTCYIVLTFRACVQARSTWSRHCRMRESSWSALRRAAPRYGWCRPSSSRGGRTNGVAW